MIIEELLRRKGMTRYRLAKEAQISHATLRDLCSGKTKLERCSAQTVYKLAKTLGVSMEMLLEGSMRDAQRESAYETGLPKYLQKDLDAYKYALIHGSKLMDCLWGELYGSINAAEISDGAITQEHAEYLRQKYLWKGIGT